MDSIFLQSDGVSTKVRAVQNRAIFALELFITARVEVTEFHEEACRHRTDDTHCLRPELELDLDPKATKESFNPIVPLACLERRHERGLVRIDLRARAPADLRGMQIGVDELVRKDGDGDGERGGGRGFVGHAA
jgi:hypothetical protein